MANPLPLVALPGVDVVTLATVSCPTDDPEYPIENVQDFDPANVAKSTGTSMEITITTSSVTPVAVALINTNAETATIEGPAPIVIPAPITIPALELDGQRVHGWLDMRDNPPTGTTFTIVLSRSAGVVWIGRICLVTSLQDLNLRYGLEMGRRRPADIVIPTRGGSLIKHGYQIRTRWAKGEVNLVENEATLKQLEANAKGVQVPFLFIPDEATNDAWYVSFAANDFKWGYPDYDVRPIPLAFEELSGGPPNG
jgi:hypothetical protein